MSAIYLEHRILLGFPAFRRTDMFERIGGQPTIDRLVDLLYAARLAGTSGAVGVASRSPEPARTVTLLLTAGILAGAGAA